MYSSRRGCEGSRTGKLFFKWRLTELTGLRVEELLREDLITGVIGALEYDPELSCHTVNHRAFLKDDARFKQVVPIGDPATVRRIHQNFHVGFIKDVVLPRALDDHTFAALNQIAFMNNVQIVSQLCGDAVYLNSLCANVLHHC